jgi:hypothetical protein
VARPARSAARARDPYGEGTEQAEMEQGSLRRRRGDEAEEGLWGGGVLQLGGCSGGLRR